jgi:hypothetical protein
MIVRLCHNYIEGYGLHYVHLEIHGPYAHANANWITVEQAVASQATGT